MTLDARIEALLFYKAEPMSVSKIAQILKVSEQEISDALVVLEQHLQNRGISLPRKDDAVAIVTSPETSELITSLQKEELSRSLSKAALETLTIIIYRGPLRRSEIDYIRGVNSQFSIRLLLVRGLIEKEADPKDERSFVYKPSFELLAHLGVRSIEDIPGYQKVKDEIESFMNQKEHADEQTQNN